MTQVTLKGTPVRLSGKLPELGTKAPDFKLLKTDLSEVSLSTYGQQMKILNIFPSIDTPTCATSVRVFNKEATSLKNVVVLNISADLPFAQKRFCGAEGIDKSEALSTFRSNFISDYGLKLTEGPLRDLAARAVVVLDGQNKVVHTEIVPEIADEPNYQKALAACR